MIARVSTKNELMPAWLLWALLALVSWGVWAILSKLIGDALSAAHSQALSTLGLLPVMVALGFTRRLTVTGSRKWGVLFALAAGFCSCSGNVAYYRTLQVGEKAATVVALTALYPIVTILLAILLLRERLNKVQCAGMIISLAAIYLFNVTGETGIWSAWLALALLPITFWGVAGFLQKLSTNHVSGELSTLWFLAAFVPVGVLIVLREPLPESVPVRIWWLTAALGFTFALGNYGLLAAFACQGKASVIVPLTALYPVVSIPIAILAFQERVGPRESIGIALALAAVLALSQESPARPDQSCPSQIPNPEP